MSVEAMAWALETECKGTLKITLIGLANHAHANGTNAWPSVDTLARYARVDRRNAQRALRRLEALGLIARDGTGPRGQQAYRLNMTVPAATPGAAPAPPPGGTSAIPGVAAAPPPRAASTPPVGATAAPPEPSREPSEEPSAQRSAAPQATPSERFMQAWAKEGEQVYAELAGLSEAVRSDVYQWLDREAPRWASPSLLPALNKAIGHAKSKARRRGAAAQQGIKHDPETSARIMADFEASQAGEHLSRRFSREPSEAL